MEKVPSTLERPYVLNPGDLVEMDTIHLMISEMYILDGYMQKRMKRLMVLQVYCFLKKRRDMHHLGLK